MLELIKSESLSALKSGNKNRRDVLSYIESQLKNEEIKLKKQSTGISNSECLSVLKKIKKQLEETLEAAKLGNRTDLIVKCEFDLNVIGEFLPNEPSEEELEFIISTLIDLEKFNSLKDMGKLITLVIRKLPSADKSKISKIAMERFNSGKT